MASYAGMFANWINAVYHSAANKLANMTGDESLRRGKSMLDKAIDNELKAVLEEWKNSSPPPLPPPPLTVAGQLHTEALNNVQRKLNNSTNLSAKDKVLLAAINTPDGQKEQFKIAEQMFTKFNDIVNAAKKLHAPIIGPALPDLLLAENWEKKHQDLENKADQFKKTANDKALNQVPPQQPTLEQLQNKLLGDFNTESKKQSPDQDTITNCRNQIHAVTYVMAKEEAVKTQKQVHEVFAAKLKDLQKTNRLDNEPSELSALATGKKYDALQFLEAAITAEQTAEKENATKTGSKYRDPSATPNLLESIHTQLETIAQKVEALQEKANDAEKSKNPILQQALEMQAHDILRLHGELGTLLNSHLNRELLQSSMSKENFELLQKYLIVLELQQQMLIRMAGKNKPHFTPIPTPMLVDADNDRTAAIAKKENLYGSISFKEKNQETGAWESSILKSNGKVVTGLTRTDILTAIAAAEIRLQKELNNPNYRIKVTEDSDGTFHYDAGNRHNRDVLHEEFSNAFDKKLDPKAKVDAKAEVQHQQSAAAPAQAQVVHFPVDDGKAAPAASGSAAAAAALASQISVASGQKQPLKSLHGVMPEELPESTDTSIPKK